MLKSTEDKKTWREISQNELNNDMNAHDEVQIRF